MSHNRKYSRTVWRKIRSAIPYTRHNTIHPVGPDPSSSVLFSNLVHALKQTTACRNRLTRLLPEVFGPLASTRDKPRNPREEWRQEVVRAINKVYRELDGVDKEPLPENSGETAKSPTLPEDQSELNHKDYLALSPDAQAVVKHEHSAWKTWEKVLQIDREAFEKQFPKWEQMDSPASAQLRHLWSRYQQSRLGLCRATHAKGGLMAETGTSDESSNQGIDRERYFADGVKVWGEPPPGVPPLEHIIRCSVLASRGLPWRDLPQKA